MIIALSFHEGGDGALSDCFRDVFQVEQQILRLRKGTTLHLTMWV